MDGVYPRILAALRDPTTFGDQPPAASTLATLAGGASVGIAGFGAAIHAAEGPVAMVLGALRALVAAGAAWGVALPTLVVLGALSASKVPWRWAVQASLIAVNFGGLGFLASVPVVALIDAASPFTFTHPLVVALVVLGVGGSASLVFVRAMGHLEGSRPLHHVFMGLFGLLFLELAFLTEMFRFTP